MELVSQEEGQGRGGVELVNQEEGQGRELASLG